MPIPQAAHFQHFSFIFLCENGEADVLVESHEFRNLALEKSVKSLELHDGVMRNFRMKTRDHLEMMLILAAELLCTKNTPVSLAIPIAKV